MLRVNESSSPFELTLRPPPSHHHQTMSTTADSPSSTATLSLSGTLHLFPTASGSNPVMESADLSSDKLVSVSISPLAGLTFGS